ncbi:MAG: CHAD domain-containing protein [Myxococcota bacterium]
MTASDGKAPAAHRVVRAALRGHMDAARAAAYRVVCAHPDPEAVHDFRVALRRIRTVTRASRDLYGKRAMAAAEATCRQYGDLTGALRDAEVLADTLAAASLGPPERVAAERWLTEVRSREVVMRERVVARLAGHELEAGFVALEARLGRKPKRITTLADFGAACLARARAAILERLPVTEGQPEQLHRLRVRFKRLRYTAEMLVGFSPALDDDKKGRRMRRAWADTARHARHMQGHLGRLNDAAQARRLLQGAISLPPERRRRLDRGLLELGVDLERTSFAALADLPASVAGPSHRRVAVATATDDAV